MIRKLAGSGASLNLNRSAFLRSGYGPRSSCLLMSSSNLPYRFRWVQKRADRPRRSASVSFFCHAGSARTIWTIRVSIGRRSRPGPGADIAFVDPGRGRGPVDRLGLAVQLSTLPWLGFMPDDVTAAPLVAVARLAERLGLGPAVLEGYGQRAHIHSDHL